MFRYLRWPLRDCLWALTLAALLLGVFFEHWRRLEIAAVLAAERAAWETQDAKSHRIEKKLKRQLEFLMWAAEADKQKATRELTKQVELLKQKLAAAKGTAPAASDSD